MCSSEQNGLGDKVEAARGRGGAGGRGERMHYLAMDSLLVPVLVVSRLLRHHFSNLHLRSGSVVVLDRGVCSFQDKAEAVQLAGGSGLIVVNNAKGLFIMPGGYIHSANGTSEISIPAV